MSSITKKHFFFYSVLIIMINKMHITAIKSIQLAYICFCLKLTRIQNDFKTYSTLRNPLLFSILICFPLVEIRPSFLN